MVLYDDNDDDRYIYDGPDITLQMAIDLSHVVRRACVSTVVSDGVDDYDDDDGDADVYADRYM